MSLLQLVRVELGEVGLLPGNIKMVSTDNLATITTAGYLNGIGNQLANVLLAPSDVIECLYSFNVSTGNGTYTILRPSISNGVITLTADAGNEALTNGHIFVGNSSNVAADIAMSGDATIANTGVLTIVNSAITNAKVSASAAIAFSKLAALASGNILVGNGSNVAASVAMSGDVTISNAGVTTIGAGAIDLAMLSSGITPSHVIKFANQVTTVGGAAAEAFTVTGAVGATDRAFVQVVDNGTANVTALQAVVTDNTLTVTFSADPGNDCIINYQIIRAAS